MIPFLPLRLCHPGGRLAMKSSCADRTLTRSAALPAHLAGLRHTRDRRSLTAARLYRTNLQQRPWLSIPQSSAHAWRHPQGLAQLPLRPEASRQPSRSEFRPRSARRLDDHRPRLSDRLPEGCDGHATGQRFQLHDAEGIGQAGEHKHVGCRETESASRHAVRKSSFSTPTG